MHFESLRGGTLTEIEIAEAADKVVTTQTNQLCKEMQGQLAPQDIREKSLRMVEVIGRAGQSLNRSVQDRPTPLDPRVNILSPENDSRLLQNVPQQKESATYFGQVMRDRDELKTPPQQVTNRTDVTIAPAAIVVNDSGSPEATAQAVQDALTRVWSKTAAGIGEETQ